MNKQDQQRLTAINTRLTELDAQADVAKEKSDLVFEKYLIQKKTVDSKQQSANEVAQLAQQVANTKRGKVILKMEVYADPDNPRECQTDESVIDHHLFGDTQLMPMATHAFGKVSSLVVAQASKERSIFLQKNRSMVMEEEQRRRVAVQKVQGEVGR